ncbi:pre-rRNA-processing protein esf2-like [Drosophila sechellia]|uniref:pre-rRNA-processing protein esf2 n=1 Tax=Drosophila sechellia TaxID=7238 RepID=UPI0013DDF130|nr:pre-rRNA-processing protein esf2 [Drosophila sechellia]XP_032579996.1 pre-rRNA-processing protein esf2 [Drosophila sechellia]XP_032579997.1 pre-rRNA-processing protein esf2 [Drosophila sechellia]XP_032579999.1 pre-rRNA-processing protein esf2-like [Drosophila sechellia]
MNSEPNRKPTPMEVEEIENEETRSDNPQPEEGESANGEANLSDDESEMELASFNASGSTSPAAKESKKGTIYISHLPKDMAVTSMLRIFGEYGAIGRAFLRSKKLSSKSPDIIFTEGWVQFNSKRVAKQIVPLLNNKQISTRKKSRFYDSLWSMKYLPQFKWTRPTVLVALGQEGLVVPLEANPSDADDEMELASLNDTGSSSAAAKRSKKGIIYICNIPKDMTIARLREILGKYGAVGRAYLQSQKLSDKSPHIIFAEGWVEFKSKRVAKQIVPLLTNRQISTHKKSRFYDSLWSMKYLSHFTWANLPKLLNSQATRFQ